MRGADFDVAAPKTRNGPITCPFSSEKRFLCDWNGAKLDAVRPQTRDGPVTCPQSRNPTLARAKSTPTRRNRAKTAVSTFKAREKRETPVRNCARRRGNRARFVFARDATVVPGKSRERHRNGSETDSNARNRNRNGPETDSNARNLNRNRNGSEIDSNRRSDRVVSR